MGIGCRNSGFCPPCPQPRQNATIAHSPEVQVDGGIPVPVQSTELRPLAMKYDLELSTKQEEEITDGFKEIEHHLQYLETLKPEIHGYTSYEGVQLVNYPSWMFFEVSSWRYWYSMCATEDQVVGQWQESSES